MGKKGKDGKASERPSTPGAGSERSGKIESDHPEFSESERFTPGDGQKEIEAAVRELNAATEPPKSWRRCVKHAWESVSKRRKKT